MATQQQVQDAINAALEADRAARLAAVSVKLPQFWPDKAKFWFAQAEAQFDTKGITVEKTKFSYVVTMLDSKTAEQAMDIIESPPAADPYTALKNRLTKVYSLSDSEKASRILDMNGLGDRTPSQCLASMLQLVPAGQEPGFLFREVFLRQLPPDVRTQLAQTAKTGTSPKDLRDLAEEADRYFSSTGSRISAITDPSASIASNSLLAIDTPSETDVFAVSDRTGQRSGARGRGARQGPRPSFTVCYYHGRFGDDAQKCEQPCQFKTAKQPGNAQSGRKPAQ